MAQQTPQTPDLFNDLMLAHSQELIAGVDEAGRGPLAGPVVAAAVILDPERPIAGLRDSKKLTARRRAELSVLIKERALAWCVADASVEEIDELNILQATLLAMRRAVAGLTVAPRLVLVDGNRVPHIPYPVNAIVKGDDTVPAISAASILAKTTRDSWLDEMEKRYPGYGFGHHKGYGVPEHLHALDQLGVLPIHRKTFAPVARVLQMKKAVQDKPLT